MNISKFFEFPLLLIPIALVLLIAIVVFVIIRKVRRKKLGLPKKEGMFKDLLGFFKKGNGDLRKRLYLTVAVLTIYIIGTTIEVPGTQEITKNLGFLELLNIMGGGALKRFSIFGLGVIPYITASIVIQLLQMDIVPYLSDLQKQGHTGKQKINKITRYLGIGFAFIEGYAMSYAFLGQDYGVLNYLEVAFIMTAGTAFLLWLGDQVTQKGFGNGVSLLIMAGIVASLPGTMKTAFETLISTESTSLLVGGSAKFALFLIVCILVVIGVIYIEGAKRQIPIQYANKSTETTLAKKTYMPIKLNSAGVIPVIFASSLLAVPITIAQFVDKGGNGNFTNFVNSYLDYTTPVGCALYVVLIIFFSYFYTFVQMKPDQMAKNLKDNGGYVPGIVPGKETEDFFSKLLIRLTTSGAVFLAALSAFPIILDAIMGLPQSVSIGGTGLLIVVGVSIETYKQMESSLLARGYTSATTRKRRARR